MKIPGLSFSWKRAIGVSKLKRDFAKATGIPMSKAGIERKIGKMVIKTLFGKWWLLAGVYFGMSFDIIQISIINRRHLFSCNQRSAWLGSIETESNIQYHNPWVLKSVLKTWVKGGIYLKEVWNYSSCCPLLLVPAKYLTGHGEDTICKDWTRQYSIYVSNGCYMLETRSICRILRSTCWYSAWYGLW